MLTKKTKKQVIINQHVLIDIKLTSEVIRGQIFQLCWFEQTYNLVKESLESTVVCPAAWILFNFSS